MTYQGRLTYDGLRDALTRQAAGTGVDEPTRNDFQSPFAVDMLRKGTVIDILTRLIGYEAIQMHQCQRIDYRWCSSIRERMAISGR